MEEEKDIIFDYQELKGAIRGKYNTQADFAKDMYMSASALNKKLNNKKQFTDREIVRACKLLGISKDEYFFKLKVQ